MYCTRPSAAALAAVLLLAVGSADAAAQAAAQTTRFTLAPHGNEARYRVREQLAGVDFPNDAIGRTTAIHGGIVLDASGRVVREQSRFTIDMTSLQTDSDRRDNYVRRNTLQTEQHPNVVFVPVELQGLPFPLPQAGDVSFRMLGDLTIRGVTRPVTWDVTAKVANGSLTGEAKTKFTFEEFSITKPRVRSVLSVDDDIALEYTFFLVPAR